LILGPRTELRSSDGVTTTFTYHPQNFRLTRHTTGPNGNHQNLTYDYNEVGNITSITDDTFTGDRTFTYDDLNRLTRAGRQL
jgi:YD repeat-containing protein